MTTGQSWWDEPLPPASYAASKVPLITAYFWIIKLLTTAMGEATSDYMVRAMNPVIAVFLGALGFAISMVLQFRARRYVPWIYWLAVAMVAVFGTMAADVLHIKFHVPYAASTVFFAVVLTAVFVLWYRSEGTLSIHSIRTPRREAFYWATVLSTFALGTATGDLTARTLHLGYLASGLLFTVAIAVPLVANWRFGMNPILSFWFAYVLTRPVGASFADYVAFPNSVGGLNAGHGPVALFLTFLIVIFVGYLTVTRKDDEEVAEAAHSDAWSRHTRGEPPREGKYWRETQQPDEYWRGPQPAEEYRRGPQREEEYWRGSQGAGEYPRGLQRAEEYRRGPQHDGEYRRGPQREGEHWRRPQREEEYWRPPRPMPPRSRYQARPLGEDGDREPPEGFFAWDER